MVSCRATAGAIFGIDALGAGVHEEQREVFLVASWPGHQVSHYYASTLKKKSTEMKEKSKSYTGNAPAYSAIMLYSMW